MDKMLRRSLVLVILFLGFILTSGVEATTREVGQSGYPYTSIQAAINDSVAGDTVLVHWGTYVEKINFLGKAITVKSDYGPGNTLIDGSGSGSVVTFNHGEGPSSVFDGFTISNGSAIMGGGIYCNSSSPTITNCIVSGNTATNAGGGISCWNSASPTITNCTVSENTGNGNGGGISCYGTCSPTISNCTIKGNTSGWGGGISCGYSSNPSITNCTISENTGSLGGGISCDTSCFPTITNCVLSGNTAGNGGGVYCYSSSSPTIINSTITGNKAGHGGGIYCDSTSSSSVKNTILWGDASTEIYLVEGGSITVTYSDVDQDGYAGISGNIRQDPLFVDAANGNFSLQATSPCVDAGTSDGALPADMKGDPRFDAHLIPNTGGGTSPYYDMGALEYADTGWDSINPPTVSPEWELAGVHFTSATDGWAVGWASDQGALLHYSGGTWSSVTPPPVSSDWDLEAVHFTSAKDGWAVGYDNQNRKGVLLHYSKGTWSSVTPPSVSSDWDLGAVHFTSAKEGWAVGNDHQNQKAILLHYSKKTWTSVTPPSVSSDWWSLAGVHFTSANEGWAVGDGNDGENNKGVILHYSGGTWTSVAPPSIGGSWGLQKIHFTSATEGWAVGHLNSQGLLLHYSGDTWTQVTPPSVSSQWSLWDVHFTSATEGWAMGYDDTNSRGVLLHYSGGTWSSVTPPSVGSDWWLDGIHFTSSNEGWAVGGDWQKGVLLHYSMWPETFSSKLSIKGFASDSNPTDGECHIYPNGTFILHEDAHGAPRSYTGTHSITPDGKSILFDFDSNGLSEMEAMLTDWVGEMGVDKGITVKNISFVFNPVSSFKGTIQKKTNALSKLTIKISGTVNGLFNEADKTMSFTYQNSIKYYSP